MPHSMMVSSVNALERSLTTFVDIVYVHMDLGPLVNAQARLQDDRRIDLSSGSCHRLLPPLAPSLSPYRRRIHEGPLWLHWRYTILGLV